MSKINKVWELIEKVLEVSDRVLLYGPPGTGKTYSGNRINTKGKKVFNLTLTPEMSASTIMGHYLPQGGNFMWKDGPCTTAWREGGRLVLNEIDHASGDVETLLHAYLDDISVAGLTLPTGEFIRPREGFQVVATMNGQPEDLPFAVKDRFPVTIEVVETHPGAIDKLPEDLREAARKTATYDQQRNISIRTWFEFAKLRDILGSDSALKTLFGNRWQDIRDALALTK